MDLVEALAAPLPVRVIGDLLGVPEADFPRFRAWTRPLVTGVLAGATPTSTPRSGCSVSCASSSPDAAPHPATTCCPRWSPPRDGDEGDRLDEDELTSAGFLLLAAGHETTVNLIANGVHALLTHPDQLALLRARPGPAAGRRRGGAAPRRTRPGDAALRDHRPGPIAGVTIPAGEIVLAGLTAAGRDPARFTDPQRLDLARADGGHVAFGHGIHHCLGAPLARLEGRIALGTLLARFPQLRLAVPPARSCAPRGCS